MKIESEVNDPPTPLITAATMPSLRQLLRLASLARRNGEVAIYVMNVWVQNIVVKRETTSDLRGTGKVEDA